MPQQPPSQPAQPSPPPQYKRHARIVGDDRTKLRDRIERQYERGASIRALAAETGRSYGFIHRLLSESSVAMRGRGGAMRGRGPVRVQKTAPRRAEAAR